MIIASPIAMKIGFGIKRAFEFAEFKAFKDLSIFLEEGSNLFDQYISLPMCFHASYSNINVAIIFTVHFSMDVNMEEWHLRVQQCPIMKTLMEGTGLEMFRD